VQPLLSGQRRRFSEQPLDVLLGGGTPAVSDRGEYGGIVRPSVTLQRSLAASRV
jgi:hypothetical protein